MKNLILSLVIIYTSFFSISQSTTVQNWCGTTQHLNKFEDNPDYQQSLLDDQVIRQEEALNPVSLPKATILKIPIVFHILHNGGFENVSEDQIMNALEVINRDFRKQNADTSAVLAQFKPIIGDVEIEFVLATKAPNGDCFKGYTRTESPLSFQGDDGYAQTQAVRDGNDIFQGNWPSNKYLNVFIVGDAGGAGGYTQKPFNWMVGDMRAHGIWLLYTQFGEIGASSESAGRSLTHEIGHWFDLSHTWGNTNEPGLSSNCNTDDGISDTPLTTGVSGSCNLSEDACGPIANVQNYMDYALSCQSMFTLGQVNVMRNAATSSVGGRNNLWTAQNLIDTGTDGPLTLCKTDFSSSSVSICNGSSITYTDESYNQATGWSWTFAGGTPATSTDQNPVITYSTPGLYQVSLTSTDGSSSDTETKSSYIRVLSSPSPLPIEESFETLTTLTNIDEFFIVNEDNDHTFVIDPTVGLTGTKSVKISNFGKPGNRIDELISSSFDLSSLGTSDMMTLSFKYAYKRVDFSDDDWLRLYVTNDCGATWGLRMSKHGFTLGSTFQTWAYTPTLDEDWVTVHVTNIFEEFFNDQFRYKFAFTSGEGNNMYIDDINIYQEIDTTASLAEGEAFTSLSMYPNPASNELNVVFDVSANMQANIQIVDVTGKIVQNHLINAVAGGNVVSMNTGSLNSGIYIMRLVINGSSETRRLIIK